MLGDRWLLDTNALIALLAGHKGLREKVESAEWIGVSVVSVLEFLGFDGLTDADRDLFKEFLQRVTIVDLSYSNAELMRRVARLRETRTLKLPDAIVAASAACCLATLVTNDAKLLDVAALAGYAAAGF